MSTGFFCLPRSLTRDPLWLDMPVAYQHVFLVILDRSVFIPTKFDDHGHMIDLQPGQVCASLREIVDWCSKYISKNDVERSLVKLKLYGFLRHEVRHKKSIITISHKDTYDLIFSRSETRSATNLRQTPDKLETQSNNENNENNENNSISSVTSTPAAPALKPRRKTPSDSISFSFESGKFEGITQEDKDRWKKIYPAIDLDIELLKLEEWCKSNEATAKSTKKWRSFLTRNLGRGNEWAINKQAYRDRSAPTQAVNPNKELASKIVESFSSKNYELSMNNESISIVPLIGQGAPLTIKWTENGFKDKLENEMRKREFVKKTQKTT